MTLIMKLKGSHGAALSTYGDGVESGITDRGPHDKAATPKPAASTEPLSKISLEAAEARGLELDQEITRRREQVAAARRALEAAKEAHQADLVASKHPDYVRVSVAKSASDREELELEGFERAKVAHRPVWLRAKIDALVAEQGQHHAETAARQQEANEFGAARKEAERQESECLNAVFAAAQRASACEQAANKFRVELRLP